MKNIIEIARKICELGFMDYPDYDPEIEMNLADALTIIISESQHITDDETPSQEIYDFLEPLVDNKCNSESWTETHFEVVQQITIDERTEGSKAHLIGAEEGTGGLYELAKRLTDKFEAIHGHEIWGETKDYYDTLEEFFNQELKN